MRGYPRFHLFRFGFLKWLVRKPYYPLLVQSVSLFLFLLVITAGLFGSQKTNIAPVLTWIPEETVEEVPTPADETVDDAPEDEPEKT